jgi:putative DNA primase/helicase
MAAREMAEQWINGNILYAGAMIDFVAANLGLVDVAEILADPERFDGETCFDPIEGRDYGHATGKFYADNLLVHSFAHGLGQTYKLRHEPQPAQPANRNRAPILCAPGRLNEMTNEAEQALIDLGGVYQRLGKIVGVGQEKGKTCDGKTVAFQGIMERGNHALMRDLARATDFERFNKGELVPCDPPLKIVHMLKEEGRSRLPILRGIISAPTLRADGSVLQDAGFDERTGLLYDPEGVEFPRIPDYPTEEEGRAALNKILHLLRGFPFEGKAGEKSASRSVAVACILTALVRQSLLRAPGFAFDAPVPRTGKSKCIDIAHAIAWGHRAAVNNWTGDRKEDEKLLGAVALSGCAALAIDNIEDVIGGPLLCEILTQPSIKVRILGLSQQPTAETAFLVTFNGNNLIFKGDITVRVLKARLDAGMEAPEERVFDFDPVDDALMNRLELVVAGLTAMRAFWVSPEQVECKPYSDFTGWSRMVRETLIWYGEPDPVDTAKEVKTEDPRREEHRIILLEWKRAFGNFSYPAKDVAAAVSRPSKNDSTKRAHPALFMALLGIAPNRGGEGIDGKKLGAWLGYKKDIPIGGLVFRKRDGGNHAEWYVEGELPNPVSVDWAHLEEAGVEPAGARPTQEVKPEQEWKPPRLSDEVLKTLRI